VALHTAIGMRPVGRYEAVAFKAGAWHDTAWYQLRLAEPQGTPAEPIPLPRLVAGERASV
jgi:phosphinothricin acetyltransferase